MPDTHADFGPAAARAADLVPEGAVVGLGTGHAATAFIHALADRVRGGLQVRGVPTSEEAARLAALLGIPLVGLDEVDAIEIDVDGADEVDPGHNLIKGYGGALVREKIVAAAARRLVILVGPEKLVKTLGGRGRLPVEVVPFALGFCLRRLAALGLKATPRPGFVSDNGNPVVDCAVPGLSDPAGTDAAIRAIPGVVGTGLFVGFRPTVIIQQGADVVVRTPPGGPR